MSPTWALFFRMKNASSNERVESLSSDNRGGTNYVYDGNGDQQDQRKLHEVPGKVPGMHVQICKQADELRGKTGKRRTHDKRRQGCIHDFP